MEPSRRALRYITLALNESLNSTYERVRIGSVVVDGNFVVARGSNQNTSHPMQHKYNLKTGRLAPAHALHSEMQALVRSKSYDLTGCEIFVGRYDRNGILGNCRPCPACYQAIVDAGIRRVTYTTPRGIISEIISSD